MKTLAVIFVLALITIAFEIYASGRMSARCDRHYEKEERGRYRKIATIGSRQLLVSTPASVGALDRPRW
jgi:hypothetical protein